ncbi:MAG: glycosyltransferase 87 family protein [Lachnospiraceae bacterium]|nr:glycosyltransferase 87 family protein [Lachnospiraceae bacterium]
MNKMDLCTNTKNNFIILSFSFLIILLLWIFISSGEYTKTFFFEDPEKCDTGMDFVNSVADVTDGEAYTKYNTLYPPLANAGFYLINKTIDHKNFELWFLYGRNSKYDLRLNKNMLLSLIMFSVISVLFLLLEIKSCLGNINELFPFALTLNYGVLYALERGNSIIFVVALVFYFCMNYDSDKLYKRELSLLCLAVAFGLKIYPAFFGVILFKEKKYKMAIKAIIYGLIAFFVPFVFFGGFNGVIQFIDIFKNFSDGTSTVLNSYGISNIGNFICLGFETIIGKDLSVLRIVMIPILWLYTNLILLLSFLGEKQKWKWVLIISLFVMFNQTSYDYTLTFMCIPFSFFIIVNQKINTNNIVYYICFCFLLLPYPSFSLSLSDRINMHTIITMIIILFASNKLFIDNFSSMKNIIISIHKRLNS